MLLTYNAPTDPVHLDDYHAFVAYLDLDELRAMADAAPSMEMTAWIELPSEARRRSG